MVDNNEHSKMVQHSILIFTLLLINAQLSVTLNCYQNPYESAKSQDSLEEENCRDTSKCFRKIPNQKDGYGCGKCNYDRYTEKCIECDTNLCNPYRTNFKCYNATGQLDWCSALEVACYRHNEGVLYSGDNPVLKQHFAGCGRCDEIQGITDEEINNCVSCTSSECNGYQIDEVSNTSTQGSDINTDTGSSGSADSGSSSSSDAGSTGNLNDGSSGSTNTNYDGKLECYNTQNEKIECDDATHGCHTFMEGRAHVQKEGRIVMSAMGCGTCESYEDVLTDEQMKQCKSCNGTLCNPVLNIDYNCYDKDNNTVTCTGADPVCYNYMINYDGPNQYLKENPRGCGSCTKIPGIYNDDVFNCETCFGDGCNVKRIYNYNCIDDHGRVLDCRGEIIACYRYNKGNLYYGFSHAIKDSTLGCGTCSAITDMNKTEEQLCETCYGDRCYSVPEKNFTCHDINDTEIQCRGVARYCYTYHGNVDYPPKTTALLESPKGCGSCEDIPNLHKDDEDVCETCDGVSCNAGHEVAYSCYNDAVNTKFCYSGYYETTPCYSYPRRTSKKVFMIKGCGACDDLTGLSETEKNECKTCRSDLCNSDPAFYYCNDANNSPIVCEGIHMECYLYGGGKEYWGEVGILRKGSAGCGSCDEIQGLSSNGVSACTTCTGDRCNVLDVTYYQCYTSVANDLINCSRNEPYCHMGLDVKDAITGGCGSCYSIPGAYRSCFNCYGDKCNLLNKGKLQELYINDSIGFTTAPKSQAPTVLATHSFVEPQLENPQNSSSSSSSNSSSNSSSSSNSNSNSSNCISSNSNTSNESTQGSGHDSSSEQGSGSDSSSGQGSVSDNGSPQSSGTDNGSTQGSVSDNGSPQSSGTDNGAAEDSRPNSVSGQGSGSDTGQAQGSGIDSGSNNISDSNPEEDNITNSDISQHSSGRKLYRCHITRNQSIECRRDHITCYIYNRGVSDGIGALAQKPLGCGSCSDVSGATDEEKRSCVTCHDDLCNNPERYIDPGSHNSGSTNDGASGDSSVHNAESYWCFTDKNKTANCLGKIHDCYIYNQGIGDSSGVLSEQPLGCGSCREISGATVQEIQNCITCHDELCNNPDKYSENQLNSNNGKDDFSHFHCYNTAGESITCYRQEEKECYIYDNGKSYTGENSVLRRETLGCGSCMDIPGITDEEKLHCKTCHTDNCNFVRQTPAEIDTEEQGDSGATKSKTPEKAIAPFNARAANVGGTQTFHCFTDDSKDPIKCSNQSACYEYSGKYEGTNEVLKKSQKGCGSCDDVAGITEKEKQSCKTCKEDRCNSAKKQIISSFISLIISVVFYVII